MYYQLNKIAARTRTTEPSMTDQSAADSTNVNVILKNAKFGQLEVGKGAATPPMYEDTTNLPEDLRDMMELARQLPGYIGQLPTELRDIPLDVLMNMTPEDIRTRLTPPDTPAQQARSPGQEMRGNEGVQRERQDAGLLRTPVDGTNGQGGTSSNRERSEQ